MLQLAEEAFDAQNDPNQLDVNEKVIERLQKMHPATLSEYDDGNGPVCWVLGIPTTTELMNKFLDCEITEKQLFEQTPLKGPYEAIYLCSAMVLEEYRNKGIASKLALDAIERMRKDNPIKALFVWAFSKEGDGMAEKIFQRTGLPLKRRPKK